jgi:hypothetical protein
MTPKTVGPPYISGMSNSLERSNQRDISALGIAELIDSLERYDFECQGGPLSNVVDWRELRARLGHPSPPIQPDPAKIAASAYTRLLELKEDIQRRERGRVSLIAAPRFDFETCIVFDDFGRFRVYRETDETK